MMVTNLRTAHAREKFLGPIRASAIETVSLFVIDAAHLETVVQLVPRVLGLRSELEPDRPDDVRVVDEVLRAGRARAAVQVIGKCDWDLNISIRSSPVVHR